MIAMASRTGTKRNLKALRKAGWWLLVSCAGVWRTEAFDKWVAENGCYTDFTQGKEFDPRRFSRFIHWCIRQPIKPQWIALPDLVMQAAPSLERSLAWLRWLRRCPSLAGMKFMLVVQNGMDADAGLLARIRRIVGPLVGIFIGGDTVWKLATRRFWCKLAHSLGSWCHVGRVNSMRRIEDIGGVEEDGSDGADSFDGSSASRFACTLPKLDRARRDQVNRRSQMSFGAIVEMPRHDPSPERLAA